MTTESKLTKHQTKKYKAVRVVPEGTQLIVAEVRHDDCCNNGHNTFSITGHTCKPNMPDGSAYWESCGCIHDDIAESFPALAPLIKWHGCSTDGPLHYISNTTYLAGDRDHWGLRKGEPRSFAEHLSFVLPDGEEFPIPLRKPESFIVWLKGWQKAGGDVALHKDPGMVAVQEIMHPDRPDIYTPNYTISNYPKRWHECPFHDREEAERMLECLRRFGWRFKSVPISFGEGKEPELEAARRTAIWPDATLEELQDKGALLARLPALMKEFRAAVEGLGFTY